MGLLWELLPSMIYVLSVMILFAKLSRQTCYVATLSNNLCLWGRSSQHRSDYFCFLFQSCKIRIRLKGYECRMVPYEFSPTAYRKKDLKCGFEPPKDFKANAPCSSQRKLFMLIHRLCWFLSKSHVRRLLLIHM
jgi:hypothetical protein